MLKQNFRTRKPRFESLEERTLLAVTAGLIQQDLLPDSTAQTKWAVNTIDDPTSGDTSDNILSLREAIASASEGDLITFDSSLAGQTITLNGTQLEIAKGITIDASEIGGITINADQKSRVFFINGGAKENPVKLTNITITGGNAYGGGGICTAPSSTLNLTNCTISGNSANYNGGFGGGINAGDSSTLTLTNCTIAGNTAYSGRSGVEATPSSTLTLHNTILAKNYYNDIYGSFSGSNNIISSDPGFIEAPLFDSYGNLTNAETMNLALSSSSRAIDRGNNDYNTEKYDIARKQRIFASWKSEPTIDIGAYEYQGTTPPPVIPSPIVTTYLDTIDDKDNLISLREAILNAEEGSKITFDQSLKGQTITLDGTELEITKGITIDATDIGGIIIEADQRSRVFTITGGEENPVELINLTITGGKTSDYGGGIFVYSSTGGYNTLTLTNCTISGNSAIEGGGIFGDSSTLTLTNCTISGNSANYVGGGINVSSRTGGYNTLTLTNCTISENSANLEGGGIFGDSSTLTLTNCTISRNSANYEGGGIFVYSSTGGYSTLIFYNSIIAQNTANDSGNDIYDYNDTSAFNAYNTLSSYTDWTSGSNNLTYDSSKPLFTSPQTGDYTLAANSQAIDKGNNENVKTSTDLAGKSRIVNGVVDLGAYEYQGNQSDPLDLGVYEYPGNQSDPLPTPIILTGKNGHYVSYGANRHQIEWKSVENAAGYELTYTTDSKTWKTIKADAAAANTIITGLTYGTSVTYKLRALGSAAELNSDWTSPVTFDVCPMDINNDGDIANADRAFLVAAWLTEEGDEDYNPAADLNTDGDISGADLSFLASNWLKESTDDDLTYPKPLTAPLADTVFTTPDIF